MKKTALGCFVFVAWGVAITGFSHLLGVDLTWPVIFLVVLMGIVNRLLDQISETLVED